MPVVALVLAGGAGTRMGRPKQFLDLLGLPALLYALRAFEECPEVARIYAVGDGSRVKNLSREAGFSKFAGCALPGEARSLSTKNGLGLLSHEPPETIVLVHDGSRCLLTPELVGRVVEAALSDGVDGVVPAVPVSDTIKVAEEGAVKETLDRTRLHAVQTRRPSPRGLARGVRRLGGLFARRHRRRLARRGVGRARRPRPGREDQHQAHRARRPDLRRGDPRRPERVARGGPELSFRVGLGVDVHAFSEAGTGRKLILGGVEIPYDRGLVGHSDADVLAHAVTDALLGAAGLEDIGHYFPDTDERFKDADSIRLLREVRAIVGDGWEVANVDAVVVCERPKIRDHRAAMRENLAGALGVEPALVGVRGTTSERLGFTGRGEGIAAQAVCLLESR
ncbi:2-C-methyl-D-erythritol 2,4-cyclodiphosphate synthase [Rubrobacter marinus]|uniref:2-C-methyl-D-erythritol 2,4-cyclodiphosphate synthase n=1 Tax=Rubrobacter marinus TaxID=2653852 RepID=A0A6G8PV32_9ACTN|nr:2-C-methyl-D-erythritol 2,4-cyclodiphosphate synthase [Rubrobacter marinus]QIN78061.1 2-C-methyl-D-erythritol 2,4-cyclodiphosphate synthase [Rubrobacter marinus]